MRSVTIYGKNSCIYCEASKLEASKQNIEVVYKNVEESTEWKAEFDQFFPNSKTVPQIVDNDTLEHIGGFLEFKRLTRNKPELLKG